MFKLKKINKLDSKRNLPLLSKATHKNSLHRNKHFCTQVCCNTPFQSHTHPKASDYLHNKEEMDLHSNLVTESKVTECNRISLQFLHKNQCHRINQVTIISFQ